MDLKITGKNTSFFANTFKFIDIRPKTGYFQQFVYLCIYLNFNHLLKNRLIMYLILLQYIRPVAAIEHYMAAHNAFLEKQYREGKFIISGRRKPRTGAIILCKAGSRREVEAILAEDPLDKFQLAVYDIIEFEPNTFEMADISS